MKVSCILITAHRAEFIPTAIACFRRQTYADRELVIYDTGDVHVRDLVPREDPRIRYYAKHVAAERSVGQLRNTAIDLAAGEFIAHWDDDDWSAPTRLEQQLAQLERSPRAHVAGYSRMLFKDLRKRETPPWWIYSTEEQNYAVGTSFFYRRATWRAHPFADRDVGEDNHFIEDNDLLVASANGVEPEIMMIARAHGRGTALRIMAGDAWSPVEDPELIKRAEGCLA